MSSELSLFIRLACLSFMKLSDFYNREKSKIGNLVRKDDNDSVSDQLRDYVPE